MKANVTKLILHRAAAERDKFVFSPRPMRNLLVANSVYALVLPVIEIFVAAYIMHWSQSPVTVVIYQMVIYAATTAGFAINGLLLRCISSNRLYAVGMLLTGLALFFLMLSGLSNHTWSFASAALLGGASGLFWGNRALLVLSATQDKDRNYYYGIETAIITLTSIAVPAFVAWLFAHCSGSADFAVGSSHLYRWLASGSMILAGISALIILQGEAKIAARQQFCFLRSVPIWRRMLWTAIFKAVAQGYIVTAPAMLVFRFIGHEKAFGIIEALGGILAAIILYTIGRVSKPENRITVFSVGQFSLLAGSVVSAFLFNRMGVLIFMAFMLLAKPLIDLGYYPIQFLATNWAARIEGRSNYSYIMSHECAVLLGRLAGCGLFVFMTAMVSEEAALRYALPAIALLELPSIILARNLLRNIWNSHPTSEAL